MTVGILSHVVLVIMGILSRRVGDCGYLITRRVGDYGYLITRRVDDCGYLITRRVGGDVCLLSKTRWRLRISTLHVVLVIMNTLSPSRLGDYECLLTMSRW